jgi:pimeloyl-ACP methyl ester carboxylesterase
VRPLENLIGGEEGWFRWRGTAWPSRRRGSGDPVLLIHSIHASAWSYEWRRNVDVLARENTVYTIDLLGFGRSDRPAVRYSAALYMALIADFAAQVIETPSVLVATSLSAAYAIALAARDPHRFRAVVPWAHGHLAAVDQLARLGRRAEDRHRHPGGRHRDLQHARRAPQHRARAQAHVPRRPLRHPELVDVYFATAHQPGAKNAPPPSSRSSSTSASATSCAASPSRCLIAWGEHAVEGPMEDLHAFRALKPDADVAIFSRSGSLPTTSAPRSGTRPCALPPAPARRVRHGRITPSRAAGRSSPGAARPEVQGATAER